MRTTFIVMSITALLAAGVGAGSAAAQPMDARTSVPAGYASDTRTTAAERALALRSAALQHRYEGRDLTAVAPDKQVAVTRAPRSSGGSPAVVAQTGFDWGDAVVGAGLLALLLGLSAGGAAAVRRNRPVAAR